MSTYPNAIDTDATLPVVNDNVDQIGGEAINALRDAVVQVEMALGTNIAGTQPSLAARLGVFINQDGTPNTSVLYSLGLVTLPVTNNQIADNAGIPESKLRLDYRTQDLYNYIRDLAKDVNLAIGWISVSGVKLEPHLIGAIYRHDLSQIDVAETSTEFLKNVFRGLRDNTDAYTLVNDINNELLAHQWADGSAFGTGQDVVTNNGSIYPSFYAHVASGIFLDTAGFAVIPETAQSVQAFADYIDGASILTLGTRIQNLYANGISRNSQSSNLNNDGYGQPIVPLTPAIAFLRGNGNNSSPVDSITIGDDMVQLLPSNDDGYSFDEKFALVKVGDIITINYSGDGYNVAVPFVISEKKYSYVGNSFPSYFVRIAGKNIAYAPNAVVQINRSLYNNNKYGVLSVASAVPTNSSGNSIVGAGIAPSLIIGSPRGAQCAGVGFSPDQFNESHYLLYLALYPTGNPLDGYTFLPGIDVTGNQGTTPGAYTLDSVVAATNSALRQPGYNYRFTAFQFEGEFGIMLADSYGNSSFSIVSAVVGGNGFYNQANTILNFPNNVVDVFPAVAGTVAPDPLGFGPFGGNMASPPFLTSYGSIPASLLATKLFVPLKRNNYYVNGNERETFPLDVSQAKDSYGDGYWVATIGSVSPSAGPPGVVAVTYNIPLNLSASGLKAGKTIVIQPLGTNFGLVNYGRYIIQSVNFTPCTPVETQITVFDAVHAQGGSPFPVAAVGSQVGLFLDSGSVSFDAETSTDFSPITANFKRHFEVYIDQNGKTFTHERGRFYLGPSTSVNVNGIPLFTSNASLAQMNLVSISPKLRGYTFGPITTITLQVTSLNPVSGLYTGNLASHDPIALTFSRPGPTVTGRIGEVTRFYDETNIDYVDVLFSTTNSLPSLSNQYVDIQVFPTLALDENIMILASCQNNTSTNAIDQLNDLRQFGNTSEEQFTTSALNYIAAPARHLNFNGIIRGFDISGSSTGVAYGNGVQISFTGGLALVNGNFEAVNDEAFIFPPLQELYLSVTYPINYALCVNSEGDLVTIVLTDYDPVIINPSAAPNRIVTVNNPVSSTTYTVDSCTFSYLLNNRKDLTPLYIISSSVAGTGSGTATTITHNRDVRRNVRDTDSSIPAVVTNDNSQGNFETLIAALNWISFNTTYQDTIYVKGANVINTAVSFSPSPLNIFGGGLGASITFNTTSAIDNVNFSIDDLIFVGSLTGINCSFTELSVEFIAAPSLTNATFNNCTVTFVNGASFSNVTFNNCTVNLSAGTFFATGITFNDCTVTQSSTFSVSSGISMYNSQVTVNVTRAFELGNNYIFEGTTFNWNNPTDGSYVSSDLVNAGNAMFHSSLGAGASVSNLIVRDCTFAVTLNSGVNRYGFFGVQFTDQTAYVQNFDISNNKFLTTAPSNSNDIRAVVSFNSMLAITPVAQSTTNVGKAPTMFNVNISNNFCNADQMIAITSARLLLGPGFNSIVGPLVSTVNCKIAGNTCGTIGFIVASTLPYDAPNSNVNGLVRNKMPGLLIERNDCKFITNLDNFGQYITFRLTFPDNGGNSSRHDLVIVSTGPATISENTANWIQVGSGAYGEYITQTTIAAGSNGVSLPTGNISVTSVLGFPTSGSMIVFTNAGAQSVAYTGTSGGNTFTGCTGGTGIMSTGGVVTIVTGTYDGMTIINNTLSPNNPSYLNLFADTGNGSPMVPGNYPITLRREFNGTGPTRSVITGNKIVQKSTLSSNGLITNTYYYDQGIVCLNSAVISGNTIIGCVNNSADANAAMLTIFGSGNVNATGNMFDRAGQTINSYVYCPPPAGLGSGNLVQITENIFDSQFVDAANSIENPGNNLGLGWNFSHNKNQVSYQALELMPGMPGYWDENIFNFLYQTPFTITGSLGSNALITTKNVATVSYSQGWPINNTYISLSPTTVTGWVTTLDLSASLPDGVNLLDVKIGIGASGSISNGSSSPGDGRNARVTVTSTAINYANFVVGTGSLLDVFASPTIVAETATVDLTGANIAALKIAAQFIHVTGFTTAFNVNNTNNITAIVEFIIDAPSGSGNIIFSPLVIKYKW